MQAAQTITAAAPARPLVLPRVAARGAAAKAVAFRPAVTRRSQRAQLRAIAQEASAATSTSTPSGPPEGFVPVLRPEDLPKGVRKEVRVEGKTVLMFWYRNQIYAIEGRSPAEGAYSEGFIKAKFTQDFCIECPATGSLFSLKDGSIVSWYPNNVVLRLLTPASTCRPLEIYPVHLGQNAISINVSGSAGGAGAITRGGSDTSLENNNVYGLEPKMYVEGSAADTTADSAANAATLAITLLAVVGVIVGGAATAFYFFGP